MTEEQKSRNEEILATAQVHFCIPCYGGMLTEAVFASMLNFQLLAASYHLKYDVSTMVNESLVTRARNSLVGLMMANPKSTHLIFIDADIRFKPEDIIKLLLRDKDIIGGPVPVKSEPPRYALSQLPEPLIEGDLVELRYLGTAFLMIKREVLVKLFEAHPNEKYKDGLGLGKEVEPYLYNIFASYVDTEQQNLLSEDWAFCQRAKKLGYKVWCDRSIELHHSGYHTFQGDIRQLY
ncbi:MAG: hypothetical protein Sapg2KO_43620 [Saprospiraceae bacterium]